MGVLTFEKEYTSSVPRDKLFNFLTKDYYQLLPKVAKPIHSVEHVGGSLHKINHVSDGERDSMLQKVEAIDEKNYRYKWSIEKGSDFPKNVEKKSFDTTLYEGPNGGSVAKITASYFYKGDIPPTQQEIQSGEDKGNALFKDIESYLTQTN
ncbi:pathogenesis-related protein class 10 [Senna tora]|uniref:Pathogenesis-related protein class 10 n=1 Tax=Senna tora TaxID=362788 RepID=A0A834W7S8_9FABA|nr:pathogenesis-related protein class 10 [Senna tora]